MSKKRGTSEEKVAAASSSTAPAAKAARKETRGLFERSRVQPIPMRDGDDPTDYVKILSWNVAGLRSYYNNHKGDVLKNLLEKHSPDILILQETKLQVTHVDEAEAFFTSIGYKGYWACSIAKKGYAGTALLVKNDTATDHVDVVKIPEQKSNAGSKQKKMNSFSSESAPSPMQASTGSNGTGSNDTGDSSKKWTLQKVTVDLFGDADAVHGGEGRIICAELDSFFLVACYVPNSGMDLSRLDYRTKQWDPFIRKYLDRLRSAKPVIFAGDLNVGHLDLDIYNFTAKHIHKQAGLTPQERASHGKLLAEGYIDALRFFYPDAVGQFTYWSARSNARPVNCGLRLDYFICSENMFPSGLDDTSTNDDVKEADPAARRVIEDKDEDSLPHPRVYDSYIIHEDTVGVSDHCPVVAVIRL